MKELKWTVHVILICTDIIPFHVTVLFLYLLKWWIIIQTRIGNTDSYSETDSEKLDISRSNQWFSLILTKVSQRLTNNQIIDQKQVSRNSSFCR